MKELDALIDEAEAEGMLLCATIFFESYWFTPEELRAENVRGKFRWGVANWQLRPPEERRAQLTAQAESMERQAAALREQLLDEIGYSLP